MQTNLQFYEHYMYDDLKNRDQILKFKRIIMNNLMFTFNRVRKEFQNFYFYVIFKIF
jgi:hypothetical protein